MADHSELMRLVESLNRAIEQAEHKPGQWAETAQSMGGICCADEPFQIGKPWAKEEPWAHFSYKRDSWLAVAAVNALPQLMALIAENEALKGLYRMHQQTETREMRDLKAEIAGLKTGYEAFEQVNAGLKAEAEGLRKDAERYRFVIDCPIRTMVALGRKAHEEGFDLSVECDRLMGKGELS
ncbi:hypothetical protein [Pseudomonas psychrophila]|uniref:hypothetical protein n=1 Tax=Pseudomonas psychrophila TaxID=122355 RepID=UPI0011DDE63B|nr:hypothetical protein [Pseudomonas psychrophila]